MRSVLALFFIVALTLIQRPARADRGSRSRAEAVLNDLVARLSPEERARTRGVYVAFDDSKVDTVVQAVCDDDGDYVVVLSDATLDLVDHVSLAVASGPDALARYEASLTSQPSGTPLLPLPAGTYDEELDLDAFERTRNDALRYVIGAELTHGTSGRLVCPRPTPTREIGDDVWTDAERTAARAARALYTSANVASADRLALAWLVRAGSAEDGAIAFLGAQGALRSSSYAQMHERPSARALLLSSWANDLRGQASGRGL